MIGSHVPEIPLAFNLRLFSTFFANRYLIIVQYEILTFKTIINFIRPLRYSEVNPTQLRAVQQTQAYCVCVSSARATNVDGDLFLNRMSLIVNLSN
jgi:hypothetical protein